MKTIKIAVGKSEKSNELVHKEVSWQQIVKKYSTHKVASKKGGEYVVGGHFSKDIRQGEFLVARTLLVIDIDAYAGSIEDLEFDLSLLPYTFVAYSSFQHTSDKPRVRVIAPLSREVTAEEYKVLAHQACLDMTVPIEAIDKCSWTPNQAMFAPQHAEGAEHWTMTQEGDAFSVPDVIIGAASAAVACASEDDDLMAELARTPLDMTEAEVDAYLAAYPADGLDYDGWLEVGMALWHQSQGGWMGKWVAWSEQSGKHDASQMKMKWKSFGGSPKPITMASVIHKVNASGNRASSLPSWADKIAEADDPHKLVSMVKQIGTDRTIDVVDKSALELLIKDKFKLLGAPLPVAEVRKLMVNRQSRGFTDIGSNEMPLETIDNIRTVCDNEGVVVQYNVIKKEAEILIPDASWSIDNAKTASMTWLRSACHKSEIRTTNLVNFVTLIADSNQYNPVATWITSKPWDGESRIGAWYDTVKENSHECSKELKQTVMLRWAMSAVMAAFSHVGVNARGVLVFQGEQYLGKTRWIESLAPKHLELIKTGKSLNVHDKDSVKQIVSSWIAELGELDATFKKSDIAALKAFITQDTDELRRPYAVAESTFARRTVFAASVNEDKFLHDPTGNTRFWVIPVESINHAHNLDMQQVWAEFYELWKKGEIHYLTKDEMACLNTHNETFIAPDPIFEMIQTHMDWKNFDISNCNWMTASDILRWIGKKDPTRAESILAGKAVLVLNKGHKKKVNGLHLRAVPLERVGIESNSFGLRVIDHIPF